MTKIEIYNQKAEVVNSETIPECLELPTNPKLLAQAILFEQSKDQIASAHVKNRGAVRGGGKKPWRQKGTGRARAGSSRSPLWRSGGVTFQVKSSFAKELPAKMHKKALFMVLSQKIAEKKIKVIQNLKMEKIQTKLFREFLKLFQLETKNLLLVFNQIDEKIRKSARNLPNVELIYPQNLQITKLLNREYIFMDQPAFQILKDWGKDLSASSKIKNKP